MSWCAPASLLSIADGATDGELGWVQCTVYLHTSRWPSRTNVRQRQIRLLYFFLLIPIESATVILWRLQTLSHTRWARFRRYVCICCTFSVFFFWMAVRPPTICICGTHIEQCNNVYEINECKRSKLAKIESKTVQHCVEWRVPSERECARTTVHQHISQQP